MMFLDTNAAIWLYDGRSELLSEKAVKLIEKESLTISPIVSLELQYLHECGRLRDKSDEITDTLARDFEVSIHEDSLTNLIKTALHENWTRDPFDRLIVSHARLQGAKLLTKDRHILAHYKRAVWD